MKDIDINKCFALAKAAIEINNDIQKKQEALITTEQEIKSLLPKGHWYSFDVEYSGGSPKKYRIKELKCSGQNIYITVKQVVKKSCYNNTSGERLFTLEEFLKLNVYKTEELVWYAFRKRICPKCGGVMNDAITPWCDECMNERSKMSSEFAKRHKYYCPENDIIYQALYEDELTTERGYEGQHFIIQCIETGEIIHTSNLWSRGNFNRENNLPRIKFLEQEEIDDR
jgi:hypothetical protein